MKFIINGRTFDTARSSLSAVCRYQWKDKEGGPGFGEIRGEVRLFRAPDGAFFLHEHRTTKGGRGKPMVLDHAREVTPEEAVEWIEATGAAVRDSAGLPMPSERGLDYVSPRTLTPPEKRGLLGFPLPFGKRLGLANHKDGEEAAEVEGRVAARLMAVGGAMESLSRVLPEGMTVEQAEVTHPEVRKAATRLKDLLHRGDFWVR